MPLEFFTNIIDIFTTAAQFTGGGNQTSEKSTAGRQVLGKHLTYTCSVNSKNSRLIILNHSQWPESCNALAF